MDNLTTITPGHGIPIPIPQKTIQVDTRAIKRIAAGALRQVDGVLGFGAGIAGASPQ